MGAKIRRKPNAYGTDGLVPIEQTERLYEEWDVGGSEEEIVIDRQYHSYVFRKMLFMAACVVSAIVAAGLIITVGEFQIGFSEVYQIIWDHITKGPPEEGIDIIKDNVVWTLRLPRVLVGFVAGFGLAVAGAVMQSTMKNPMADSYTTGISSGAAFGATLGIVLNINIVSGDFSMIANSFLFSLAPTALIVLLSQKKALSSTSMILAGLAVMYIFNALTAAIKLMADPDSLAALYRFQVGTLNNSTWEDLPVMAIVTVIGTAALVLLSNRINVLSTGDESAKSLGINASKLRILCLVIVSLVSASIVAYTGIIGFVGLVAPHVARIFIGSDNKYLIPAAAVFGALLMIVSDFIGRTIISPSVLEVGVVTAFIGGPLFLWLILRQQKEVWS